MLKRDSRNPALLAAVLAGYFALGKLGLAVGSFNGTATAVWPPSGFALVAILVFGRTVWPAILFGALLAHSATNGQVAASVIVAIGDVLEAVVGAALVDRVAGGTNAFRRADTIIRFAAIAALVSTPLSATVGATARTLAGAVPWSDFVALWVTCWLGHLSGILVVAPFIALWAMGPFERRRWFEVLESLVLLAMMVGVGMLVFGGRFPSDVQNYPIDFLCVPFLLWAAVRFGRRETASALLVLSGLAIWGTLRGYGPFVRDSPNEALVLVQAYTSVMAIAGLVLAAAIAEHKDAEEQLRQLATTDPLTGLVNYRRLIEVLRAEIARSNRTKRPFAVLFLDMNGLKKINDRCGHLIGSRALARLAETLRASSRSIDTPARFGGDEFAIVLPETGEEGGLVVLQRVCETLAADPDKPAISVSGGVAVFPRDGDSPTLLLRAADTLLYEAKPRKTTVRRSAARAGSETQKKTGTLF